mmetsp:Transcript_23184/g.72427  ORF Transcript_23184/g.72427 Transcript_23184/m.72427 type:complete len:215 (+) Transcript_23184:891-1535(+)
MSRHSMPHTANALLMIILFRRPFSPSIIDPMRSKMPLRSPSFTAPTFGHGRPCPAGFSSSAMVAVPCSAVPTARKKKHGALLTTLPYGTSCGGVQKTTHCCSACCPPHHLPAPPGDAVGVRATELKSSPPVRDHGEHARCAAQGSEEPPVVRRDHSAHHRHHSHRVLTEEARVDRAWRSCTFALLQARVRRRGARPSDPPGSGRGAAFRGLRAG